MGWSGTDIGPAERYGPKFDRKAAVRKELTWSPPTQFEILKDAMVGNTYYGAVKLTKLDQEPIVFGVVVLTKIYNSKQRFTREFLTKFLDESMEPCEARCPKGILDILDKFAGVDPESDAGRWRARCRANLARPKPRLKEGQHVKFAHQISFSNGEKLDTFVVTKNGRRVRFSRPEAPSWHYRIKGWSGMKFTVLAAAQK